MSQLQHLTDALCRIKWKHGVKSWLITLTINELQKFLDKFLNGHWNKSEQKQIRLFCDCLHKDTWRNLWKTKWILNDESVITYSLKSCFTVVRHTMWESKGSEGHGLRFARGNKSRITLKGSKKSAMARRHKDRKQRFKSKRSTKHRNPPCSSDKFNDNILQD